LSCWTPLVGHGHRDHSRISARVHPAEQRAPLSGRSTEDRGDHRGDAYRRRERPRAADPRTNRDLWRAGLRINEALPLAEPISSPPAARFSCATAKAASAAGSGWTNGGWEQIEPWRRHRPTLPVGPFPCIVNGPMCGRSWSQTGARAELRRLAALAGLRRRFAPHQLRHAHAVEMAREGVPLTVIQRQVGHAHLGVTSTYLPWIDTTEIINSIHARRAPMIPGQCRPPTLGALRR
jgi:integrase